MKVLVTGHLGYIGTSLVPLLLARGHDVTGLDIDLFRRCTFGGTIADVPNICKDIRDVKPADLHGFDCVMHLAGLCNDPLGDLNPAATDEINHIAAVRVARAAREAGVPKFIFSSTVLTYGAGGGIEVDETCPLNPLTPYARAKVDAEKGLLALSDDSFAVTILRNATAFGWSPRIRFDLVLNNLVAWACTTGRIYMKSDGTPWRPIVHVEDIARAFIATAEAPADVVAGQVLNVAKPGENYQVRDIASLVASTVPDSRIEYAPDAKPDPKCFRVKTDRITRLLPAYKPVWTAAEGVRQVYEMVRALGLKLEEFEGPRYQRLAHARKLIADGLLTSDLRLVEGSGNWSLDHRPKSGRRTVTVIPS